MVLTLDARTGNYFPIIVAAAITEILIENGTDGQVLSLVFQQDATGHAVSAGGGNIQGFVTPSASPNALSAQQLICSQTDDTWISLQSSAGAPLNSPAFTGTPTAPTAAPGTNTTQLATTAFVEAAVSGGAPLTAKVTISSARILTLFSVPVPIIPAPGVGKYINVLNVIVEYQFGTTPYDVGEAIELWLSPADGGANDSSVYGLNNAIITQTSDQIALGSLSLANGAVFSARSVLENQGMNFASDTSDPTGGDGVLVVTVVYEIGTFSPGN